MEPCNLTVFVFCINVKITGISSELTKISQKEFGVLFGPHVETTKLSDMSKRTVNQSCHRQLNLAVCEVEVQCVKFNHLAK